jgi:polysaccharide biosynthesis protein PslG
VAGPLLAGLAAAAVIALAPGTGPSPGLSATSTPAPPVHTVSPLPFPGTVFGANVNWLFNSPDYAPAQVDALLSGLVSTGATVARSDALWEASQPRPPHRGDRYDWRFDDRIATALALHGLQWLPIIDYSASWAESIPGQDHSPPASDQAYANYAAAVAARYGVGGNFWRTHRGVPAIPVSTLEIWNEPDNPEFWPPAPSASRYLGLYLTARAAIRHADPSAAVIVGGLTRAPDFLRAMLAAYPGAPIDGVAIHPYAATPQAVLRAVESDRMAMAAVGLANVPLYVTELGWTTSPSGSRHYAAPTRRAGYIERALSSLGRANCRLAAVILYTWSTPERDPGDPGQWFGVQPPGAGDRLSADARAFAEGLRPAIPAPGCS